VTAQTREPRADRKGRGTRALLVGLILVLILLLCGLVYVLRAVTMTAERTPKLAEPAGVEFVFQAFGGGALGEMASPMDVAYDGDDTIYVTVPSEGRVLAFDERGGNGRVFVSGLRVPDDQRGLAEFDILRPTGIDVGDDGLVYVGDGEKMAVVVFNAQGEKLREFPVMSPKFVEVAGDRVYVDTDTGTLFVMDLEGNVLGQWGTRGREPEQLSDPMGLAVDDEGVIYLADMDNYRLIALSPELELMWQYGEAAFTEEEHNARLLAAPAGVTLAADGNLYLIDGLNSYIRVFDRNGEPVSEALGERGENDDQFFQPMGLDWMEDDLFVIADTFHSRIVGVRLTPQVLTDEQE